AVCGDCDLVSPRLNGKDVVPISIRCGLVFGGGGLIDDSNASVRHASLIRTGHLSGELSGLRGGRRGCRLSDGCDRQRDEEGQRESAQLQSATSEKTHLFLSMYETSSFNRRNQFVSPAGDCKPSVKGSNPSLQRCDRRENAM